MDGFVFRDIVRGFAPNMPIFFLTALDPEEGSGFPKRILEDAISYYLPKTVNAETLLNRVRQVVASHRVEISNTTRLADLYAMAGSSANRLFNGVNVDND